MEGWIKSQPTNVFIAGLNPTNDVFDNKYEHFVSSRLLLLFGHLSLQLGFAPASRTSTNPFIATGVDLRDGRWHHFGCTFNRSATNGGHLYIDGVNALTFNPTQFSGSLSNPVLLLLGFPLQQLPATASLIDEFTMYGRALSADEMASVYQAGSAGKSKNPPPIIIPTASPKVTRTPKTTIPVSTPWLGLRSPLPLHRSQ